MFCPNCGKEIHMAAKFCPHCGFNLAEIKSPAGTHGGIHPVRQRKNWLVALLLSFFLGGFGADRFYLGYTALGVIKLLTFGGFGIWAVVDCILIGLGKMKDADGRELEGREGNEWVGYLVVAIVIFAAFIFFLAGFIQGMLSDAGYYYY